MNFSRLKTELAIILRGHILNYPWRSRMERRRVRGEATAKEVEKYLDRYIGTHENIALGSPSGGKDSERIFSMWLQGEEQAPPLARACFGSIRANSPLPLIVLNEENIFDWIELPSYIIEKRKEGRIRPAHFADICRVALLYRYGGYWMDATDYLPAPTPEWMDRQDFFVYLSAGNQSGSYSFIQNCFIRSAKGSYLAQAWLKAIYNYWKHEDSTIDYFMHQLLFKRLVEKDERAAEGFALMPKLSQEPTHRLWYLHGNEPYEAERFKELCGQSPFHKCDYKSEAARNPVAGSVAEHIINSYK